jgi:hypothetical protein
LFAAIECAASNLGNHSEAILSDSNSQLAQFPIAGGIRAMGPAQLTPVIERAIAIRGVNYNGIIGRGGN